jgi:PAS domain S-box-containing protein
MKLLNSAMVHLSPSHGLNNLSLLPEWAIASVIGHGLLEVDGVWLGGNPALCKFLGRPAEQLAGSRLSECLQEHCRSQCDAALGDLFAGKTSSLHIELEFKRPDKSIASAEVFFTHANPADVEGVVLIQLIDITERKLAERNLRQTLENLPIPAACGTLDPIPLFTLINEQFVKTFGYSRDELKTVQHWIERAYPDESYRLEIMTWWVESLSRAVHEKGLVRSHEVRIRCKDGTDRDVIVSATLLPSGPVVVFQDVTERNRTAAELEAARQSLEKVAYELTVNMPAGTYAMKSGVGITPHFTFLSQRMLEITGLDRESVLKDSMAAFSITHPEDQAGFIALNNEVFATKKPFRWEGRVIVRGKAKWLSIESNPRELADGTVVWEGMLTDITARKAAEHALAQALQSEQRLRDAAERATKAKSRFLANISHEIRTPLSTLVALTRSMIRESEKHKLPLAFDEYLQSARAGGQYLNLILTNLLDISAIESGHAPLRVDTFYLGDWVDDVSSILTPIATTHGVRLIWNLPADDNLRFRTDPIRLTQILLNLAHNAVKFSDLPGAAVTISIAESPEGLRFTVRDEGPGVDPARLDGLFEEYAQSDTGYASIEQGIGLGLAIVKENTRLLSGSIEVAPVNPRGLCFQVTLPMFPENNSANNHPPCVR